MLELSILNLVKSCNIMLYMTVILFFFKSTIYYIEYKSKLWQLRYNYLQKKQTYIEKKKKRKERKRRKIFKGERKRKRKAKSESKYI